MTLVMAWDSVPAANQRVGILLERPFKEKNQLSTEEESASALAAMSSNKRKGNRTYSKNNKKS